MTSNKLPITRQFEEAPMSDGNVHLHGRYFTTRDESGLVSGTNIDVMFTIDRPTKDIWPVLKDFNLWQKGHQYSGILGDLEGKTFYLSLRASAVGKTDAEQSPFRILYDVVKVIPEHLLVLHQPLPEGKVEGFPGLGRVSPGFHVFMLNEHGGKTVITVLMNHASLMEEGSAGRMTDEQAINPWRDMMKEGLRKWRDEFIPDLKTAIAESRR